MSSEIHEEQIVQQISGCQDRLFAYILALVPDRNVARDILQETNLVLWRRREEFVAGTSFVAWASKVTFFQTLAYRRDRGRDRHVFFSEELMIELAGEAQEDLDTLADQTSSGFACGGFPTADTGYTCLGDCRSTTGTGATTSSTRHTWRPSV